jgi:Lrp/AsnC family leucine-responsive transcriptional regulator
MNRRSQSPGVHRAPEDLDRIDRLILKALESNGRKPVSELAREVHLTTSPCLDRVRRLEEEGYIQGYSACLNHRQLGARLVAFVGICLDRTTPEVFERFRAVVESREEIVECHMVAGGFDYLIKIRVADMDEYRKFLGEQLTAFPGIAQAHTYVAMEELKPAASAKRRVPELVEVAALVEDSLRMNRRDAGTRCRVLLTRDFGAVPAIMVDKHKVLQILMNLERNAIDACEASALKEKNVTVRIRRLDESVQIEVIDNGIGIAAEDLERLFQQGFATQRDGGLKKDVHGFGLHSCALAAHDLGGSLKAFSAGLGCGATFTLTLPLGAAD